MSIGLGIVLVVIGAILTFALNITVDWIDLQLVGYILMVAGVIVIIFGIVFMMRRRRSVTTSQTSVDPSTGDQVTRNESSKPEPL